MPDGVKTCVTKLECDEHNNVPIRYSKNLGSNGHVTRWAGHSEHFYQDDRITETESKTTITEINADEVPAPSATVVKSTLGK